MDKIRRIIFYKTAFLRFYEEQNDRVRQKIDEVLFMITIVERVPKKFLLHLEGTKGLYEIRVELSGNIYRIFCCFDEGKLVVLLNGFQKKSQKTPRAEIVKAEKLKTEYLEEQRNGKV